MLAFAAVAASAAVVATPARAHAVLTETSPSPRAVLDRAPDQVVLRFDESVSTVAGSLRVFDRAANRVDEGIVGRPSSDTLAVRLRDELRDDVYTVAWRVLSADSHPIHGAYVFTVGEVSGDTTGVADEVLGDEDSPAVDLALTITRFAGIGLILLCIGGAAVLGFVADTQTQRRPVLWIALGMAALLLAINSVAWIALTGVQAVGLGLDAVLEWPLIRDVVDTGFGRVWVARAALAVALGVLALLSARGSTDRWMSPVVFLASAIGVTPALSGHARVEGVAAMVVDAVHTLAAGVWVGGLAFLALMLVVAGGDRWSLASVVVPRFSTIALMSVCALVASGVVTSFLEVGSWDALRSTTYGRLVLVKVALLLPLLALGAFNNRSSVPRLRRGDAASRVRRGFAGAVSLELVLIVVVVGVTSVLVAEPPADAAANAPSVVSREGEVGPYDFTITVEPAVVGRNDIHLYLLDSSGQPADVDQISLTATLPDLALGPLSLDARPAGPGHVVVPAAELPLAGAWEIRVDVRKGEFDEWSALIAIPIRKDS